MQVCLRTALSRRVSSARFLLTALALLAAFGTTSKLFASEELIGSASSVSMLASSGQFGSNFHPVGMTSDANGNVYVVDSGSSSLMKLPAGCKNVSCAITLMSFIAPPPPEETAGIYVDAQGDIYFSDPGDGLVYELPVTSGGYGPPVSVINPQNLTALNETMFTPGPLTLDSNGNLFVADMASGNVLEVPAGCGSACVKIVLTPYYPLFGLAAGPDGSIYVADPYEGKVWQLVPSSAGYTATQPYTSSQFGAAFQPWGVTTDAQGDVYISNVPGNNGEVLKVPAGCTSSSCSSVVQNANATGGALQPFATSFDSNGNLYVLDENAAQVLQYAPNNSDFGTVAVGQTSSPLTVTFSLTGQGQLGSTPFKVLTQGASGLDFADAGNSTCNTGVTYGTYVNTDVTSCRVNVSFTPTAAGERNGAVELIDSNGNVVATAYVHGVGKGPQLVYVTPATLTSYVSIGSNLGAATAIVTDGNGNVFVTSGSSIQEIASDGTSRTLDLTVTSPSGLAVDGAGNLYVSDSNTNTIKILSAASGFESVRTVGTGLSIPKGLAVDGTGNIFVADTGNNAIKELTASTGYATITTLPSVVSFPVGVALDSDGNLYVTDSSSAHVQEFTKASGYASATVLGNYSPIPGVTQSEFTDPQGIAVDAAGDVYVADSGAAGIMVVHATSSSTNPNGNMNIGGLPVPNPKGVALDSKGNLYFASLSNLAGELVLSQIPSITFPTPTVAGTTDMSDPAMVEFENAGNDTLVLTTPAEGLSNPSIPTNFQGQYICSTSDPMSAPVSSNSIAPGQGCGMEILFAPTVVGDLTGDVVLTDNNLNGSPATQAIHLKGTALPPPDTTTTGTSVSSSSLINTQSVTVTAKVTDTTTQGTVPVGSVTFTDTVNGVATPLNTVAVDETGSASITYAPTTGSHVITSVFTPTDSTKFATSGDNTGATVSVAPYGAVAGFNVTVENNPAFVGLYDKAVIKAVDSLGNFVPDYSGAAAVSSTDASAAFNSTVNFEEGMALLKVTFKTLGNQTLTATADTLTGTSAAVTVENLPSFVVTVATDDAGVAGNCTNQGLQGATPDANCSLRDALAAAAAQNVSTPTLPIVVSFSPAVFQASNSAVQNTILLNAGAELTLPSNVTIQGATSGSGATLTNLVTVDGNKAHGLFVVPSGATGVALNNLNIVHGAAQSAVVNNGTLTVSQSTITRNSAENPGGGLNNYGSVTITDSTISDNSGMNGGGLANETGASMTVVNSTIAQNAADGEESYGGGIYYVDTAPTLTNVTVAGNSATYAGGGISGGGSNAGSLVINNTAIVANTAPNSAGIYTWPGSAEFTGANYVATLDATQLSTLGNYGGPTQTMLPMPGSQIICAGSASQIASGVTTDQRGLPSTTSYSGQTCVDAGAVNTNYSIAFSQQPTNSVAGKAISPAPSVQLSENGVPVSLSGASIAMSASAGTLSGTASQSTASAGLASFGDLSFATPQSEEQLTATLAAIPARTITTMVPNPTVPGGFMPWPTPVPGVNLTATSDSFSVRPPVTAFVVSAPATATAGQDFTVTVTAMNGSAVATDYTGTITFTSTASNSYFGSATYTFTSADQGVHTFTSVELMTEGTQTVTVTDSGVSGTSGNIAVAPEKASFVRAISGSNQSAVIGAAFTNPLVVEAVDMYGNAVSGVTVNLAAPTSGASANLSSTSVVTGSDGTASVTATANGIASTSSYAVVATGVNLWLPNTRSGGAAPRNLEGPTQFNLTNTQAAATLTVGASSTALAYGQPVTINAAVTPANVAGSAPTGNVTFYDGATALTPDSTMADAAASYAVAVPTVGEHQYSAKYAGDTNFAASTLTPAASTVVISKASVTLTGPTQPAFVVYGESGTVPVTVTGQFSGTGISMPSGVVNYTILNSSNVSVANGTLVVANGSVSVPVANDMTPGVYTIAVSYIGDNNYKSTDVVNVSLQVGQIQPVINWNAPQSVAYGTTLGGVLDAAAVYGSSPVAGTYSYTAGNVAVTAGTVLPAGSYTLTVNFTPNDTTTYKTATSQATLVVNQIAPAGVNLVSSVNPVLVSNATVLTATVSSAVSTPTGTVTFLDGSTPLGSAPVVDGVATLSVSTMAIGTHTLSAVYSGDANFTTGSSNTLSEQVHDFELSITASTSAGAVTSQTIVPGGQATYQFTLTPNGSSTFVAPVALTVSGLPEGATYTITPTSIAAGSGATAVTLVVTVPNQTAALHPGFNGQKLAPFALALLMLPFSGRTRRRARKLGRMLPALLLLVSTGAIFTLTGCGASTGYFGQQQKTYNVTVTGTSGALVHSTSVTLTVE